MAVRTDVINGALTELGQDTSVGVDADTRKVVVSLRSRYEKRAEILLTEFSFNFATKAVKLTKVSGETLGWLYRFNKPPKCLRIMRVTNTDRMDRAPDIPFEEREGEILSDCEDTYISYVDGTYASNDSGAWPEIAKHALSLDLANIVAPTTDMGREKRAELKVDAYRAKQDARRWDSQQNKVSRPPMSRWQRNHISGRRGEHG